MSSELQRARLMALIAVLLWSSSGVFAKSPYFSDWPEWDRALMFGVWRAGLAACVLLPFARQRPWDWRLIPTGFTFAVMNTTFMMAMVFTTSANAIWLQATAPLWVGLAGWICWRQVPARAQIFQLVMIAVGLGIILSGGIASGTADSSSGTGIWLGLISGMTYAGVIACLRWQRDLDSLWVVGLGLGTAAIAVLPILLMYNAWHVPNIRQFGLLLLFGAIQLGLPYLLIARALRTLPSLDLAILVLLEPVLVPTWVWLLYRELPDLSTFIGASVILGGLAMPLMVTSRRRHKPARLPN